MNHIPIKISTLVFSAVFSSSLLAHAEPTRTMKDMQALMATQSWSEIVETARQVPPSARDAEWQSIVSTAGENRLKEKAADPMQALTISEKLIKDYPTLKKNVAFMKVRGDQGLKAFESCFEFTSFVSECNKIFKGFVADDPQNDDLAFKAGVLVTRRFSTKEVAMPYFHMALKNKKSDARCSDASLATVLTASLEQKPPAEEIKLAQEVLFGACADKANESLIKAVTNSDAAMANSCAGLLEKNVLTGPRLAKCKRMAAK